MSSLFIAATGTDIGKTFVTAGLIRHLRQTALPRQRGSLIAVDAIKPIVSGFDLANVDTSDSGILLRALGRSVDAKELDRISPWRFSAPLSPDMAARKEGTRVDFDRLIGFCKRAIAGGRGVLFIEGVGGIMSPLNDEQTGLDWMAALDIPVLLIAGSYLGTITHTLTALEVLKAQKASVAAIVINESLGSSVDLMDTADAISRFARGIRLVTIPRIRPEDDHPAFAEIAELL